MVFKGFPNVKGQQCNAGEKPTLFYLIMSIYFLRSTSSVGGGEWGAAFYFFIFSLFRITRHIDRSYYYYIMGGANPAVNTPRPSWGTRIESCDIIVLIGDP